MAHCVNRSSPEFIALAEQSNINPIILAAKVSLWQEENGLDNFPALEDVVKTTEEEVIEQEASPKLISLMKEFIKSIGVDYKLVSDIVVDGVKQDANGVALIMQKLIQVVEGQEDVALPEEAMHFAVEIIRQTNPKLYQQLLKEINGHPKLNAVIALSKCTCSCAALNCTLILAKPFATTG